MHAPLPDNETERLAALKLHRILDTPPDPAFDRVVTLATRLFNVPTAAISLIDERRQWFKASCGLACSESPRVHSFCAHAILEDEVFVVPDAAADPRFRDNPLVDSEGGIRFYAGAPLITPGGHRLGTLCISDRKARKFCERERQALRSLAGIVASELSLRRALQENRQWSAVIDSIDAGVVLVDMNAPDMPITFANTAFYLLTGYQPEEVIGHNCRFLQGSGTDPQTVHMIRDAVQARLPFHGRILNYRRDGEPFWNSLTLSPVFDAEGRVAVYMGLQKDVTTQHRHEELTRQKLDAERANRAKSEFLSRMSHELRTPLNAILGFSQLLGISPKTLEEAECVKHIQVAGRHLLKLVDEVLDVARIESGRIQLSSETFALNDLLEEALAIVRPLAAQHGVTLPMAFSCYNSQVVADQRRLKQVVLNLLTNAVKYNRTGGSVQLDCVVSHEDNRLRLRVSDTGPGIPADMRTRLFTSFDRLGAEGGPVQGTGLGLVLCKRLVEAMGGTIGYEENTLTGPDRLKFFWVELPLAGETGKETVADKVAPEPVPWSPDECLPGGRTVLYIEDNLSNLRLIERLLGRFPQVRLLTAMQASIGLDMARQHRPDLILLDVHLPDLPGAEVVKDLRADEMTAGIPILVISADATERQIKNMQNEGIAAYLTKPIDVHEFLRTVRTVLIGDPSRN